MKWLSALFVFTSIANAADWPQWRGPARDGVVKDGTPWPAKLDKDSLQTVWRVNDLGPSYSGPIIADGMVFTTETVDKKVEVISAYNQKTGKKIWDTKWDGAMTVPFFAASNGSWIRSTPAYFAGKLYVGGIKDLLVCLDAKSGQQLWSVDFPKEFNAPVPTFGCVCSPLVDETGVYVQAGAALVKLDAATGKVLWKTLKDDGGMNGSAFSSPIRATVAGKDQVLVQTRTRLAGVNPQDGAVIWEKPIAAFRGMNILTPVTYGTDGIFTSTYGGTSQLLKLKAESVTAVVEPAWSVKYEGHMTSPVVVSDHAYLLGRDQRFICIDMKSGREKYRTEKAFGIYWSLVAQGDKILALDDRGILYLLKANPTEFELLGETKIADSPAWAHLAIVGGELYIRDLTGLSCLKWK
jgi:outer membrane protein assembly factor BamB